VAGEKLPVSFKVITFGCPVNQYESEAIAEALREAGFVEVEGAGGRDGAGVYIINSCAVTGSAAREARRAVRRAKKENPAALVVLAGCYPQVEGDYLMRELPEADVLIGTVGRSKLPQIIREHLTNPGDMEELYRVRQVHKSAGLGACRSATPGVDETSVRFPKVMVQRHKREDLFEELPVPLDYSKMRPVLKIQEGCDEFCTYCTVIRARGWPRSLYPDRVLEQVEQLLKRGYREIVLAGTHLGIYGKDLAEGRYGAGEEKEAEGQKRKGRQDINLAGLLRRICMLPYNFRVRLGYIEPMNITDDLLAAIASLPAVCNHLYIPLQSGSDKVLQKMGRSYTAAEFARIVRRARTLMHDVSIWTDLIVGFPSEEEEDHRQTVELVKMLEIDRLHVFPYSPRAGTPAARFTGQVRPDIKKRRVGELKEVGKKLSLNFHRKMVGKKLRVLVEKVHRGGREDFRKGPEKSQEGAWAEGYSDNYVKVIVMPAEISTMAGELPGKFITVRAEKAFHRVILGRILHVQE